MGWEYFIPIIAQYSLGVAEKLWQLWAAKGAPTAEDWAVLNKLKDETAHTRMVDALTRAGIALDDPKAIALLDLVKPKP